MALLTRAAGVLALSLSAACDFTRPPSPFEYSEDNVAVYAVLEAGADTVRVSLARFDARAGVPGERFTPVSGARAGIVHGSGTTGLVEAASGFTDCFRSPVPSGEQRPIQAGCYAARLPVRIASGETYRLRVHLPDGDSIAGSVVVPHPPRLRSPEEHARVEIPARASVGTVQSPGMVGVGWAAPPGVGRIEIAVAVDAVYREQGLVRGASCRIQVGHPPAGSLVRLDSVALYVFPPDCVVGPAPAVWDSITARLVLTAYDTAYARYVAEVHGGSVRRSRARAGVSGALGVFGAAASAERKIVLVRESRS